MGGRPTNEELAEIGGDNKASETIRIPSDVYDKLRYVASRRKEEAAQLLQPVIEPWVQSRFLQSHVRLTQLARDDGPRAIRAEPKEAADKGSKKNPTTPVRVRRWLAYRLAVIRAIERVTISSLITPVLQPWVEREWDIEVEKERAEKAAALLDAAKREDAFRQAAGAGAAPPEPAPDPKPPRGRLPLPPFGKARKKGK